MDFKKYFESYNFDATIYKKNSLISSRVLYKSHLFIYKTVKELDLKDSIIKTNKDQICHFQAINVLLH